MNIWVINQFAGTPESGWGERHFYFARHWLRAGHKVKIISGSFNHLFKRTVNVKGLYKYENFEDVDFYWVKTPKYRPTSVLRLYSMMVFMLRILLLPSKKIGKPDVIIVSSMPIFPILSGYWLKRKYGAKLLFEIRDIWPLTLQHLGNKSSHHPAVLFIGWFEKLGYRRADAVVSLLPNARSHIESVAKQPVRFHYIPNGIDAEQTGYEAIPEELDARIPHDKFVVGYAGTIGLANALEYFVDATISLKEKHNLFFVVVGDGYLKSELEAKTEGLDNILFYPKIRKAQVQKLIARFDLAFVGRNDSPLFNHGVSANKYFDYMLAGKPILDSNNYIKDPVELSGCGLIVKPDSTESIVAGIKYFTEMPKEERLAMGEKGRQFVLKEHAISELALRYSDLFT